MTGVVNVSLRQTLFPVRNLTVGLLGCEDVHFIVRESKGDETENVDYYGYFEVIRLENSLS